MFHVGFYIISRKKRTPFSSAKCELKLSLSYQLLALVHHTQFSIFFYTKILPNIQKKRKMYSDIRHFGIVFAVSYIGFIQKNGHENDLIFTTEHICLPLYMSEGCCDIGNVTETSLHIANVSLKQNFQFSVKYLYEIFMANTKVTETYAYSWN